MNSDTPMTPEELHKALFNQLIFMLTTSVLQQLGKMENPMTQKAEISLEGAAITIDMLDMLASKTKGNLEAEEEKFLTDTLTSLKMSFVEVQKQVGVTQTAETQPSMPTAAPDAAAKPDASAESDAPPPADDDKKPKFQKKYD